jgi:hypothetical protein
MYITVYFAGMVQALQLKVRNDVCNLFVNAHDERIKIYREFYHCIIHIANEGRHVRIVYRTTLFTQLYVRVGMLLRWRKHWHRYTISITGDAYIFFRTKY